MGREGIPFYVLFWIIVALRLWQPAWLGDVDLALSIMQGVMLMVLYIMLGTDARFRIERLEAEMGKGRSDGNRTGRSD